MDAITEVEEMPEYVRIAEAWAAHAFCLVANGCGVSKNDSRRPLRRGAARRAQHLERWAALGDISVERAERLGSVDLRVRSADHRDRAAAVTPSLPASSATSTACGHSQRCTHAGPRYLRGRDPELGGGSSSRLGDSHRGSRSGTVTARRDGQH
jgi:hypothetical protein